VSSNHENLIQLMRSCTSCILSDGRTQVVVGDYSTNSGICFIGEAPGFNEDTQGKPFVGRSGKLLDQMLESIGISRNDVSILNIVKCRPPNNRTPTRDEMNTCGAKWLKSQLTYLQPNLIVTLGSVALKYFFPRNNMTATKGHLLFTEDMNIPLIPLFHPAYILRNGNKLIDSYKDDFSLIIRYSESRKNIQSLKSKELEDQKSLDEFF